MYVCLCNGIKDSELKSAALKGAHTPEQAYAVLGIEMYCSQCHDHAQTVIDDTLGRYAETL